MKYLSTLAILFFISCEASKENPIYGAWKLPCTREGEYRELIIHENYSIMFSTKDEEEPSFFKSWVINDSLTYEGINVGTVEKWSTLKITFITSDSLVLTNVNGDFGHKRLPVEVPEIDSSNFDTWLKKVRTKFNYRSVDENCRDLRTEEEKNPDLMELGVVEESFEEIEGVTDLPEWAQVLFSFYESDYYKNGNMLTTLADFSGNGVEDIVISITEKKSKKEGFLFLFSKLNRAFIAGAGTKTSPAGDDFKWADHISIFTDSVTYKTTFLENGDVDGVQRVTLEHAAIKLRQDEGSGGLIYFNGEKLIWIHQGD